jgi:hypothetical protein
VFGFSSSAKEDKRAMIKPGGFRFCFLNICSIINKTSFLLNFVAQHSVQVAFIAESWLSSKISNSELFLPGYSYYRIDRTSKRGGGLFTMIDSRLPSKLIDSFISDEIELMHVSIQLGFISSHFILIYRPPSASVPLFVRRLSGYLDNLRLYSAPVVLIGDFNINYLSKHDSSRSLKTFLRSYDLTCLIDAPTRFSKTCSTLIDYLVVNSRASRSIFRTAIAPASFSDHSAIVADWGKPIKLRAPTTSIDAHSMTTDSIHKFVNKLKNNDLDWTNVDSAVSSLILSTHRTIDSCFPKKKKNLKVSKISALDWFSNDVRVAAQNRDIAHSKFLTSGSIADLQLYRIYRNNCNVLINCAKRSYFARMLHQHANNPKRVWSILNQFHRPSKSSRSASIIPSSSIFNSHFISSVSTLALIYPDTDPSTFVPNIASNFNFCPFTFREVDVATVTRYFSRVLLKGPGPNAIHPRFLKLAPDQFCRIITKLVNFSFSDCVFPHILKVAKVIPIHKNGSQEDVSNYRPVSTLSNISKIFERVAYCQLYEYLSSHSLLSANQHGFRPAHSTITSVVSLISNVVDALDKKLFVCVVLLDFSKAFDLLNHKILISKLSRRYNLSETACNWITSFLSGRTQFVYSNNVCSSNLPVSHGVPQGSILGPLLFNIYIADINESLQSGSCIQYADDTALVFSASSAHDLCGCVNRNLAHISRYCVQNHLKLNEKKTNVLLFGSRNIGLIYLNGETLQTVDSAKYLGFLIDTNLSFRPQADALCKKLSSCRGVLLKVSNILPFYHRYLLFRAIGASHVTYSSVILASCSKGVSLKISQHFNSCGRALYNCSTRSLSFFNWIDCQIFVFISQCCFLHKVYYSGFAPRLRALLLNVPHKYNTRSCEKLYVTHFRTKTALKSFTHWAPRIWNIIPIKITKISNHSTFKNLVTSWVGRPDFHPNLIS